MHVSNTQINQVVQSGGLSGCVGGSSLRQAKELSGILNSGAGIGGKVSNMELVDDRIVVVHSLVGTHILIPTLRIGGIQINNHRAVTIHTGGSRIRVTSLVDLPIHISSVGVIGTVQVSGDGDVPYALLSLMHIILLNQVIGSLGTALIKVQIHDIRGGRPYLERGAVCGPGCTQIITGVGVCNLELIRRIYIGHGQRIYIVVMCDSIGFEQILHLCQILIDSQLIFGIAQILHIGHFDYNFIIAHTIDNEGIYITVTLLGHGHHNLICCTIINCSHNLDAIYRIAVILGERSLSGGHIAVDCSCNHIGEIHKTISAFLGIPVTLADNKAYLVDKESILDLVGSDHLAILFLEIILCTAGIVSPHPYIPVGVISICSGIMNLDENLVALHAGKDDLYRSCSSFCCSRQFNLLSCIVHGNLHRLVGRIQLYRVICGFQCVGNLYLGLSRSIRNIFQLVGQ